jgi:type I restriction enzyme S subunit
MQEKYKSMSNVPNLRFPEFDGKWEMKKLGEVANISSGGTPSRANPLYWNGNIPWVSTTLIDFNFIEKSEEYITEVGLKNSSAKLFPIGTLLMAMYGQGKTRGKISILNIEAATNQACGAITTNKEILNSHFAFQNLVKRYDEIRDLSNQGGQENLSGGIIKGIEICFPALTEQQKIATFLSLIDERIQTQNKIIGELKILKATLSQKILSQQFRFKDNNGNDFGDWKIKKLGEVCEVKKGKQLNKEELTETGEYPCINGGINLSGYTNKFNSLENKITISEGGNSCGYINFFKVKFWSGGHNYSIEINDIEGTDNNFLFQLLKHNETEIMKLRVGSGLPNIQKKDLVAFPLVLPISKEEQTKIANFLSSIDEKMETENQISEQYQMQKQFLLKQMFV